MGFLRRNRDLRSAKPWFRWESVTLVSFIRPVQVVRMSESVTILPAVPILTVLPVQRPRRAGNEHSRGGTTQFPPG